MKLRRSRRGATGFTLIEVLVAIALFAFGMLALAALFTAEGVGTDFARQQSAATMLAQQQLETLMQTPYLNVTSGTDSVNEAGGAVQTGQTCFTRRWVVINNCAQANTTTSTTQVPGCGPAISGCSGCVGGQAVSDMKAICVTVTWTGRQGETHSVTMRMNKGNVSML